MVGKLFKYGSIILLVLILGAFGSWAWRYYTAETKGKVEAKEKTESGNYRIYSYDHFYDMYQQVQSYDKKIEIHKKQLEKATSEDERRRIRQNLTGLRSQRSDLIQQYNADARKEKTKGKFQPDDLPRKIEPR